MRRTIAVGLIGLAIIAATPVQEHDHGHSPYAGAQSSEVPSLTDQEIAQLRAGEGMGLAKPAELNGYPGPKHVLELADELELSPDQRDRIEAIYDGMHAAAVETGERLIAAEKHLNNRFRHQHIDEVSLAEAVAEVAAIRGELRTVHLSAHLTTHAALTAEQRQAYDRLRGYTKSE
jgi:Spy/CpxP family protein refolding chaperone